MINTDLKKEIKFIAINAAICDLVLIIATLAFIPFINILTGVVLGTVLLILDMFFLSLSIQSVVAGAEDGKNGSAKMTFLYFLRLIFLTSGLIFALKMPFISVTCAAIPLFYPKIIYFIKAIFCKKEG